jgi:hypothetical protein
MDRWLLGAGKVTELREGPCVGRAYHGIFRGELYDPIDNELNRRRIIYGLPRIPEEDLKDITDQLKNKYS